MIKLHAQSQIPLLDLCLSMGATEVMMNSVIAKEDRVVYVNELFDMTCTPLAMDVNSWASRSAVMYFYTSKFYAAEYTQFFTPQFLNVRGQTTPANCLLKHVY